MSQSKQLSLRPANGTAFVQGWPGIPAAPGRPGATVSGRVLVRLGKGLNASWLRIELRKVESTPNGEQRGELIGNGPQTIWRANSTRGQPRDPNMLASDSWEFLTTRDFSFALPVPEALPPTAKIDKQVGISYELVASLCVRLRRGVFRKKESTTSNILQTTHPVIVAKHDLHPSWFLYNYPDQHETQARTETGPVSFTLHLNHHCMGPGDTIALRALLLSEAQKVVKPKHLTLTLKENITYKVPPAQTNTSESGKGKTRASVGPTGAGATASQRVNVIATRSFPPGKKLKNQESRMYDLSLTVPKNHSLMTISTAKHIEVSYTLRLSVDAGSQSLVIDHVPIKISSFSRSEANALLPRIGYVAGLSDPRMNPSSHTPQLNREASQPNPGLSLATSNGPPPSRSAGADASLQMPNGETRSGSASTVREREGSIAAMSAIARGPLHRSNTLNTMSTGLSTALAGPNFAGRGIPGAFDALHPDAGTSNNLYPTPTSGHGGPSNAPQTVVTSAPVRAAMVSQHHIEGLQGPERLALTNQIDRGHWGVLGLGPDQVHDGMSPSAPTPAPVATPAPGPYYTPLSIPRASAPPTPRADPVLAGDTAPKSGAPSTLAPPRVPQVTFSAASPTVWDGTPSATFTPSPSDTPLAGYHTPSSTSQSTYDAVPDAPSAGPGAPSPAPVSPAAPHAWESAEEEKLRLYNEARARAESYQPMAFGSTSMGTGQTDTTHADSEASGSGLGATHGAGRSVLPPMQDLPEKEQMRRFLEAQDRVSQHQQLYHPSNQDARGGTAGLVSATPPSGATGSEAGPLAGMSEKEQMRRFLEAQDQVAQHQARIAAENQGLSNRQASAQATLPDGTLKAGTSALPAMHDVSEKEQLRRFLEAQDRVAQHQAGQFETSASSGSGPSALPPMQDVSEKEQVRRFLEAQDRVAQHQAGRSDIFASGGTSPLGPGAPNPPSDWASSGPSAAATGTETSALPPMQDVSEKEQLRRFLEARDRVAQHQAMQAEALSAQQRWNELYGQYETTPVPTYDDVIPDSRRVSDVYSISEVPPGLGDQGPSSASPSPLVARSSGVAPTTDVPTDQALAQDHQNPQRSASADSAGGEGWPSSPSSHGTLDEVFPPANTFPSGGLSSSQQGPAQPPPQSRDAVQDQSNDFYSAEDHTQAALLLPTSTTTSTPADAHIQNRLSTSTFGPTSGVTAQQSLHPAAPPSNTSRFSYDASALGAYGSRGALVVDCSAPRGVYDPVIATTPWGSLQSPSQAGSQPSSGVKPQAPPRPPKILL